MLKVSTSEIFDNRPLLLKKLFIKKEEINHYSFLCVSCVRDKIFCETLNRLSERLRWLSDDLIELIKNEYFSCSF